MLADLGFRCRPIDKWPGEFTKFRTRSQFSAHWRKTLELLGRELSHLNAKNGSLLLALYEHEITHDGSRPRADARPAHPGVILALNSKHGPLKYTCDRFDHWRDNIRAIALGLEALRAVDRYGITRKGEQYQGYKQLGAARQWRDVAAMTLVQLSGLDVAWRLVIHDPNVADRVWKAAAKRTHPDVAGGSSELFRQAQEAREVLAGATP